MRATLPTRAQAAALEQLVADPRADIRMGTLRVLYGRGWIRCRPSLRTVVTRAGGAALAAAAAPAPFAEIPQAQLERERARADR